MAEITQELGFDASQAIATLNQLDQKLVQLNSTLELLGTRGFNTFNRGAGRSVAAMVQLRNQASLTQQAVSGIRLNANAFSGVGTAATRLDPLLLTSNRITKSVDNTTKAVQDLGKKLTTTSKDGVQANQSLTISFQTMARIITTQLIVRALAALQESLSESVTRAIEFQRTIAEIQTIANSGQGFRGIATDVLTLSDAFGADLGDVGAGLYQTISNQIAQTGTAAERASGQYQFLSDAIKFSIAGVTTVESSVNLLAGTLNALGIEADRTGQVAAQFFKTIELGRTTATELANSFGTVAPIAGQLGVSLEELQASFATITIGGLDTAKAATQIRGALTALLKPTTQMREAFEQLGVSNGQQAIELFGFQGALEAVISTTDGTAESIAQLVPRVRGLSGVLRIASEQGANNYRENLQQIIQANEDLLNQKFEIVFNAPGVQLERDLNRIRNFLTEDFGESIIESTNEIVQALGGVDNVIEALDAILDTAKLVTPILAALIPVFTGIAASSALASKNVGLFGKSLSLLALPAIGFTAGQFIGQQIKDILDAESNARQAALKNNAERRREISKQEIQIEESKNKLILADFKRFLADVAKENAGRIRDARRTADQVRAANESAFEGALGASTELERRLRSQFRSREDQARDAVENIQDAEQQLREFRFNQGQRGLSDRQKFANLESRITQEQFRLNEQLFSEGVQGGDTDAIDRLREQQDLVQRLANDLQNLAQTSGSRILQEDADVAVQQSLRERIELEREVIGILNRRREAEKRAADEVAENNRKLKGVFAELVQAQDGLFEAGISGGERDRRFEEFAARRLEFLDLIQRNAEVGAKELADFGNVLTQRGFAGIVDEQLSSSQIDQLEISQQALANVRQQLKDALEGQAIDLGVELNLALDAAGFEGNRDIDSVRKFVEDAIQAGTIRSEIQKEIENLNSDISQIIDQIPTLQQELEAELSGSYAEAIAGGLSSIFVGSDSPTSQLRSQLLKNNQLILDALRDAVITDEELGQITLGTARFNELINETFGDPTSFSGRARSAPFQAYNRGALQLNTELNNLLDTATRLREELSSAELRRDATAAESVIQDPAVLNGLKEASRITGERAAREREAAAATNDQAVNLNSVNQAAASATNQLSLMVNPINQAISAVDTLQARLNNLTVPAFTGQVQNAALGKKIDPVRYYNMGGFRPRGTDTVPAMLSPGERVINARSSAKFASQLQAIQAGVQPIYRQEGGTVTNVGDINVTVSGENSEATGRNIASVLRRELRRGTTKF